MDNFVLTMTRCDCCRLYETPCTLWYFDDSTPRPYQGEGVTLPREQVPNQYRTGKMVATAEKPPEGFKSWEILPTGEVSELARNPCETWYEEIQRVYTLGYRWARFIPDEPEEA